MAQMFDTNVQQTTGVLNMPAPHAVEDDSTANLIGQLGSVGLNEAQAVDRSITAGKKLIGQSNLAEYSINLGKIQQAVAQGTMSSSAARTRIRSLRSKVIANNPSLLPQIDSTTSSFLSDSGLGSDIVKGTKTEQLEATLEEAAAKDGFHVTPDMPQDQRDDVVQAWQQFKHAQNQLQMSSAQIAVTRGKLGITSDQLGIQKSQQSLVTGAITQDTARIALDDKLHQHNANQAIFTGAKAYTTNFNAQMNDIVKKFNASDKSPAAIQAATDQVNIALAQVKSGISQAGLGSDQNVLTQAIAPMEALATATTGFINGKVETQAYTDAVNNAQNSATLMALHAASPKSLKVIGTLRAAPGISQALSTKLADEAVLQITGDNSSDPAEGKAHSMAVGRDSPDYLPVNDYLDGIRTAAERSNLGQLDPNSEKLLGNNINNIANGLLSGQKAKSPKDYNRIVQFLSDPAINAYVVKHPDVMRTANLQGVSDMLYHEYTLNIEPLVKEQWKEATVPQGNVVNKGSDMTQMGGGPLVPSMPNPTLGFESTPSRESLITPQFTGGGIRFVANDPSNQQAVASAATLNEKVAPTMGRLIKATATLGGTNNYRKVWNETYAGWFGQPTVEEPAAKPAPAKPAATEQSLTLDKPTPELMNSVFDTESNGDNTAVSSKGAVGIGQMMPATAEALGYSVDDLKDPNTAKKASTQYMGMMLDRFDGNVKLALAAYNYGPTAVAKLVRKYGDSYEDIKSHLPKETRDYVPKVLGGLAGR